tara:strand:- start:9704 stop:9877 length:174 start_codon:yes stop_codon:yes gene_type:complete
MKRKSRKKTKSSTTIQKNNGQQNKTTAKLVLFIFGIGPILGIIIFLASKGFFETPKI